MGASAPAPRKRIFGWTLTVSYLLVLGTLFTQLTPTCAHGIGRTRAASARRPSVLLPIYCMTLPLKAAQR